MGKRKRSKAAVPVVPPVPANAPPINTCRTCKEPKDNCRYAESVKEAGKIRLDEPKKSIGARRRAMIKMLIAGNERVAEEQRQAGMKELCAVIRAARQAGQLEEGEMFMDMVAAEDLDDYEQDQLAKSVEAQTRRVAVPANTNTLEPGEIEDDVMNGPPANWSIRPASPPHASLQDCYQALTTDPQTSGDGAPAPKRRKIPKEFWTRKQAIFPPQDQRYAGKCYIVDNFPAEVLFMVLSYLMPPTLVNLAFTCKRFYYTLNDPRIHHLLWEPARRMYKNPMPPPYSAVDGGLGVSETELQWAIWMFGGGECAFCGQWTNVPPACFSLNIHICLMQECRAHWRKQTKQNLVPIVGTDASPYRLITANPVPPPGFVEPLVQPQPLIATSDVMEDDQMTGDEHEADDEMSAEDDTAGIEDPTAPNVHHSISLYLQHNDTIISYVYSHPNLYDALVLRPEAEQISWLKGILDDVANGSDPFDLETPPGTVITALSAFLPSGKKKKVKKPCPYPQYFGEIDSIIWPSEELKDYVRNGMTFAECGPMLHNQPIYGLAIHRRRKYRLSDMFRAVGEWLEAEANGTLDALRQEWKRKAKHVENKIVIAQRLMRWREERKGAVDRIRTSNDTFIRLKAKENTLEWHDASNSPTLVRMRNLSELAYQPLTEETWTIYKDAILHEANALHKRRVRRDTEAKIRHHRAVAASFHRYCMRKASEWGLEVMPPFRIFNTFPTVASLPDLFKELPNWQQWIDHAVIELKAWEEKVLDRLEELVMTRAGTTSEDGAIDPMEWATSLFRCTNCDTVAEIRAEEANVQARKEREASKTKRPPKMPQMPKYKAPMTWREIVGHACDERYDVMKFQLDLPAARMAAGACGVLSMSGKQFDHGHMVELGKAWGCNTCGVNLNWTELYGHCLRHLWEELHASASKDTVAKTPRQLFPKGIRMSVGPTRINKAFGSNIIKFESKSLKAETPTRLTLGVVPARTAEPPAIPGPDAALALAPNFCKKMINGTHNARHATKVMCALCRATLTSAEKPDKEMRRAAGKVFGFDALRDHLKQKHKILQIRNEDVVLVFNALEAEKEARGRALQGVGNA